MGGRTDRVARALAVLAAGWLAAGCSASKTAFQAGLPGTRVPMNVASVEQRAGIIEAELHAADWTLRTYLPASEVCARVVASEAGVEYVSEGGYGSFVRGDERCDAIGIGSLREWRSRRPRGDTTRSVVPSAPARYRIVYQDEEVAFLRGRFPLAARLGVANAQDVIAVVPRIAVCQGPLSRQTSTLEYFEAGKRVLALVSSDGRCPIEGLIRPPAGADFDS